MPGRADKGFSQDRAISPDSRIALHGHAGQLRQQGRHERCGYVKTKRRHVQKHL